MIAAQEYWASGWWQKAGCGASLYSWKYWIDPYFTLRISGTWYIIEQPSPRIANKIKDKWEFKTPHYFVTLDPELARQTLTDLSLPIPNNEFHCHKIYWYEPCYHI